MSYPATRLGSAKGYSRSAKAFARNAARLRRTLDLLGRLASSVEGRGASGDTPPYAVEREREDIEALVVEAGGSACLCGSSSGGVLALDAANRLEGIKMVALFEAPFIVDDTRPTTVEDWVRIREAVTAGRPGDAVKFFL